eukprot:g15244.t1
MPFQCGQAHCSQLSIYYDFPSIEVSVPHENCTAQFPYTLSMGRVAVFFSLLLAWVESVHLGAPSLAECQALNCTVFLVAIERDASKQNWTETFSSFLAQSFARYGCDVGFNVNLSSFDHIQAAASSSSDNNMQLHFAFANPLGVARLHAIVNSSTIATARRIYGSAVTDQLGGVLVARKDVHPTLAAWTDLSSTLTLCAARSESYAFDIVSMELLERLGVRSDQFFSAVHWVDSMEEVLAEVYAGSCDVGAVLTGALEQLAEAGIRSLSVWQVIGQQSTAFPLLHSTQLYPEWGLVGLPHVPAVVMELVRAALINVDDQSNIATAGNHGGFRLSDEYTQAELIPYQLAYLPDSCPRGYDRQTSHNAFNLSLCEPCATGRFSDTGVGECKKCRPRYFSDKVGAVSCELCPAGFTSRLEDASSCVLSFGLIDELQYDPIAACINRTLIVGVAAAEETEELTYARWKPTFDSVLNSYMNRFQCYFKMVAMKLPKLKLALLEGKVDFMYLDSGVYTLFKYSHGAKALVTSVRTYFGHAYNREAGAIYRRKDKHQDLFTLQDLQNASKAGRNMTLCPLAAIAFSGNQAQRYEFFKQGMDVREIFGRIVYSGSHEESVRMVARGECDVGMSRSHTIETVLARGECPEGTEFVIINEQTHANFPLLASTELYNEWPFVALPHVPEEIWSAAMTPLLAIRDFDDAAVIGDHAGFIKSGDFSKESNINFQLNMNGNDVCEAGSVRDKSHPLVQPCVKCAKGWYNKDGVSECRKCPPSTFSDVLGASACQPCPVGKTTTKFGETECHDMVDTFQYDPIDACGAFTNRTLIVGVAAAEETEELTYARWKPTFDSVLNSYMNRFQCYFKMVAMKLPKLKLALLEGKVDFMYLDSGVYTLFKYSHGAKALVTSVRTYFGHAYNREAGAIYRRKDKHQDLFTLQDLQNASKAGRNMTLCPLAAIAFSGNQAQRYEFFKQGMDVREIFGRIVYSGSHEESVRMVARGECDVGMSRSHTIETVLARGECPEGTEFVIINEQTHANFPLLASTELYNEWPFVALPHVPEEIWSAAMTPLLAIRDFDDAAVIGDHAGFIKSGDFSKESNINFQLNMNGNDVCEAGSVRDKSHPLVQPCVKCAKGHYNEDGVSECRKCPPSTFSDVLGAWACQRCPIGKITHTFGETECYDDLNPIEACAAFPDRTLTVGVLISQGSAEETLARWKPTFEDLLNDRMDKYQCYFKDKYQCYFKVAALSFDALANAVNINQTVQTSNHTVDFVFVDPLLFTIYEHAHGLKALVSVVRSVLGQKYTLDAGVIFSRKASSPSDDIMQSVLDVQRVGQTSALTACGIAPHSFSGWVIQEFEFFKKSIRMQDVFAEQVFYDKDDEVVHRVWSGDCDVGMVPSHTLQSLVQQGHYDEGHFSVIGQQLHPGFSLDASTPLYKEWPFGVLPHVSQEIWSALQAILLELQETSEAALVGQHAGFVAVSATTSYYQAEANVSYQLNLVQPSSDLCQQGSMRNLSKLTQPCELCPPGRFNADGLPLCRACDPDFYSDKAGSLVCSACPAGKATKGFGDSSCVDASDILFYQPIEACQDFPGNRLTVGVLYEEDKDEARERWQPTFEGILNGHFNRYQCYFDMQLLAWHEVQGAVQNQSVDLLFCNPDQFVQYRNSHKLRAVASVIKIFKGRMYQTYGGVILRNASLHTDVLTLQDLAAAGAQRDLIACAPYESSFSGLYMQRYELFKAGIDMDDVFRQIEFAGNPQNTLKMLAAGKCDVALVGTKTLEYLVGKGEFRELEDFAVIGEKFYDGFVPLVSTELYAEWPLAALPHVPKQITELLPIPLLAMKESSTAAVLGSIASFTSPYNYNQVSTLRYQLALEPLKTCGPGASRNETAALQPCQPCPPGYYSADGMGACTPCAVGFFSPEAGGSLCVSCGFGMSTLAPGGSKCVEYAEYLQLNPSAALVIQIFCAIFGAVCLFFLRMVILHRQTKLMKASSAQFNMVLIAACAVLCGATGLFTVLPDPHNWICSLRWWLPCMGASTVFGTIFAKTYRLHAIFRIYERKQKIPQTVRFKDTKVAFIVLLFVVGTGVVLSLFFIVSPPFHVTRTIEGLDQNFDTYVESCEISLGWVTAIFSLYALLLCVQCWLAYRVRKLPTMFNESQLLAWLLYNSLFLGLVGIMVDSLLDVSAITGKMTVRAIALLLGACTPVVVLYVPKLMEIYRDQQNSSKYGSSDKATTNSVKSGNTAPNQSTVKAPVKELGPDQRRAANSNLSSLGAYMSKKNASQVSAISGMSDGSDVDGNTFDICLVPDSDVAGDEELYYSPVKSSDMFRASSAARPSSCRMSILDAVEDPSRGTRSLSTDSNGLGRGSPQDRKRSIDSNSSPQSANRVRSLDGSSSRSVDGSPINRVRTMTDRPPQNHIRVLEGSPQTRMRILDTNSSPSGTGMPSLETTQAAPETSDSLEDPDVHVV